MHACAPQQQRSSTGAAAHAWTRPRPHTLAPRRCLCASPTAAHETGVVREQPHIVEIYGLTRAVTSTHLEDFALNFLWGGTAPNIKWVDDEHALAVFPCAEAAAVLLGAAQSQYKVRPFSRASRGALSIPAEGAWLRGRCCGCCGCCACCGGWGAAARRTGSGGVCVWAGGTRGVRHGPDVLPAATPRAAPRAELTPPRAARPMTTTAVARRLISNALGNREVRVGGCQACAVCAAVPWHTVHSACPSAHV
jgi:hypothetical protein